MPGAGAAHQGPNGNTQLYRSLFSASQDARFLGLAGSETESGQSGLPETDLSQASPYYGEIP